VRPETKNPPELQERPGSLSQMQKKIAFTQKYLVP